MLQIGLLLLNLFLGGVSKSVAQAQLMLTVHDIDEPLGFLTKGGVKVITSLFRIFTATTCGWFSRTNCLRSVAPTERDLRWSSPRFRGLSMLPLILLILMFTGPALAQQPAASQRIIATAANPLEIGRASCRER